MEIFRNIYVVRISPFCGVSGALSFGLRLTPPMGFKARVDAPSPTLRVTLHEIGPQSQLWPAGVRTMSLLHVAWMCYSFGHADLLDLGNTSGHLIHAEYAPSRSEFPVLTVVALFG